MRLAAFGVLFALASAGPAAEPVNIRTPPPYPTPLSMSILGLSITAIAVVGARASRRTTDTMMYMVLASLAVTAVMVAYADKVQSDYYRGLDERLKQFGNPPAMGGGDVPAADGK
jgi:hypothetical protein